MAVRTDKVLFFIVKLTATKQRKEFLTFFLKKKN